MFLVPHSHLHLVEQREDRDCDPMVDLNKMKDKHMARNYGSPSVKVESCQKVSYPSLFWWTLETALLYFNWGASQNCPQLGWWVVTVPKGIGTLVFLKHSDLTTATVTVLHTSTRSSGFHYYHISYLPKHLKLCYLSHNSSQSYWFYLPACFQSYFG